MAAKQKTNPRPSTAVEPAPTNAGPSAPHSGVGPQFGKLSLQVVVFVSGAVLMGLEIVGSRILAPYFGNSVFVWGSLISLFLIALSVGYYVGGRVADRRPSRALLNSILVAVAASMFAVAMFAAPVCEAILTANFGEKWGPFVASAILFLLPSIGMGMVSPFAIRLATHTVASVGKTAGTLYALSTLGSIAGTMLTTFFLIPSLGAGMILKGLAGTLLVVAVATFPFASRSSAARGALIALGFLSFGLFGIHDSRASLPPDSKLVRQINTPYHQISIADHESGSRLLLFDSYIESQISLTPPYRSLSAYTEYFHLAMLVQPEIRRVLFIGAGGGVGPRAFHMHDPAMEIDVVDIDAEVLRVAETDFYLEKSPNIRTIAADGRTFVRNAAAGHYDAIILDAFTIGGRIPFHLVTQEFFTLCRERLAPGGVLVMNINSAVRGPKAAIFRSMYKTIDEVFQQTHAFVVGSRVVRAGESTNIMLVAAKSDAELSRQEWSLRAGEYQSSSYVDRGQVERMIDDLVLTMPDLADAAVFTDDYAPIETMSF